MELIKIVLSTGIATALCWSIHCAFRDYHYNAGVLDVVQASEALCRNPNDFVARARLDVLCSNARHPKLRKFRTISQTLSCYILGFVMGYCVIGLL